MRRAQPGERRATRLEPIPFEEAHPRIGLRGARVYLERSACGERLREPSHRPGSTSNASSWGATLPGGDHVAALEVVAFEAHQVGGDARHRARTVLALTVRLQGTYAGPAIAGSTVISSPTARQAPVSVPVATVPAPLIVKTRSTKSLAGDGLGAGACSSIASSAARSRSSPSPVADETGTGGRWRAWSRRAAREPPARRCSVSSSTRSSFVRATTPPRRRAHR